MSYDIFFVRRDPGQSFEDALEAAEDPGAGGNVGGPLSSVEIEQWERILPHARTIFGDVEEFVSDTVCELSHNETGVQLSVHPDEISITVPYWHSDEDSVSVMEKVYALAYAVEDETGLEGYDPQLDEPIRDARRRAAPAALSATSRDVESGEIFRGGVKGEQWAEERATPKRAAEPADGNAPARRRWWEFWKR